MIETKQSKTHDIPVWLTVLVLLLCIGGGAWMIRWYMKDKPKNTIALPDDRPTRGNLGGRAFAGANGSDRGDRGDRTARWTPAANNPTGDGVTRSGRDSYVIRAATATVYVSPDRRGVNLNPSLGNLYTPEDRELINVYQAVRTDRTWRDTLKITDEQQKKLRDLPPALGMKWEKADEAKMVELWRAYEKANEKTTAQQALVSALTDIAKRAEAPTREYHKARLDQIRTILTAEQIKAYKEAGTKPAALNTTPAPKPDVKVNTVVTTPPQPEKATPPTTAPPVSTVVPTTKPAATTAPTVK